jgi:hypothetical protein
VLVRDDQIDVAAKSYFAIAGQTFDGGDVVGLLPETILIKPVNGRVAQLRWLEPVDDSNTGACHARGLVLKPRLVGCDLAGLRRS